MTCREKGEFPFRRTGIRIETIIRLHSPIRAERLFSFWARE
jgi:hypothetical protein